MPETNQPIWKCVGHIGDVDPIAHSGGFVYEDTTGVYGPEIAWFDPASDEDWKSLKGAAPLDLYRFVIERNPEGEWWFEKLADVAASCGRTVEEYKAHLAGSTMDRAWVYFDLVHYFGDFEFDQYPVKLTEDEAYAKYADEVALFGFHRPEAGL